MIKKIRRKLMQLENNSKLLVLVKTAGIFKNKRTHKLVDSRLRKDIRGQKKALERNLGKRKAQRQTRKPKKK